METLMSRVAPRYPDEIANAQNPKIRQFYVPRNYNLVEPQKDVQSGNWVSVSPKTIENFSAVAYFFAKELYKKYKVPVGVINCALGGSPVQAWISEEALKKFPEYYDDLQKFKDTNLVRQIERSDNEKTSKWYNTVSQLDEGTKDKNNPWYKPDLDVSTWEKMQVPSSWTETKLGFVIGIVWVRKTVNIPSRLVGKKAKLIMGRIVDSDIAYINGVKVGNVTYQYPPRRYNIPDTLLKAGENTIALSITSNSPGGGFIKDKAYQIEFDDTIIDLKGEWNYKLSCKTGPFPSTTNIKMKPSGLYNGMVAPLTNYAIKGVLWYQGESNADRPGDYKELTSTLIEDWRSKRNSNFPFLYVQLPNYGDIKEQPTKRSNWALIREAQLKLLSTPNSAMAVTIDVGEWNDIHPLRKQEVGYRLSLAAMKLAYNEKNVIYSGPIYKSYKIEGNKIIISFEHTGSGLMAKGNEEPKEFAIAGADKKFVWANAKIEGDKIVVWNDEISAPIAVRYAWGDCPVNANVYNKEGLPASPFRTDEW
jgi:sialate O-acetylesterase